MCLIFVRNSQKEEMNYDAMAQAFKDNPDGVGVMWWEPDFGWKELRSVSAKYEEVEKMLKKLDSRKLLWAVHYRWATAGSVSKRNCHPFPIGGGAYMMHNGILPYTPGKKDRSDTWAFAQMIRAIGVEKFDVVESMLKEATRGSRMLYALPDGSLRYSGDWVHKPEGYYSNGRCLYTAPKYVGYNTTNNYTRYVPKDSTESSSHTYYRYKNTTYDMSEYDERAVCVREAAPKVVDDGVEYEDVYDITDTTRNSIADVDDAIEAVERTGIIKSFHEMSDAELAELTSHCNPEDLEALMSDTVTVTDKELEDLPFNM
jgi:hypothetical protein